MGPIQSSINTTIGMIAGLKKLGNIGEGIEDFDKKANAILAENKKNTEAALAEYKAAVSEPGNGKPNAPVQMPSKEQQMQMFGKYLPEAGNILKGFSAEKSETALNNVSEQQIARIQQQEAAKAYREAIRQREEDRRTTTYSFNPETKQSSATSMEVKR